jgi:hypothetical protein
VNQEGGVIEGIGLKFGGLPRGLDGGQCCRAQRDAHFRGSGNAKRKVYTTTLEGLCSVMVGTHRRYGEHPDLY